MSYRTIDVPVAGGSLRLGAWGEDGPMIVAVHGITANHLSWLAVAEELGGDVRLIAPDLRGRGRSAGVHGPFGMAAHARDVVSVLDAMTVERAVVVGHSMGAFVAAVAAARHPDRVAATVFVDGGLPLTLPEGMDVDAALEALIGPAMARLAMTFPTRQRYREYWQAHPAWEQWDERAWAYLDYDLVGEEPELRSSVSIEAVRADAADTMTDGVVPAALADSSFPAVLVRAERGTMDGEPLYPDPLASAWPQVATRPFVPGTNHYTILFRRAGVEAIVNEVRAACGLPG